MSLSLYLYIKEDKGDWLSTRIDWDYSTLKQAAPRSQSNRVCLNLDRTNQPRCWLNIQARNSQGFGFDNFSQLVNQPQDDTNTIFVANVLNVKKSGGEIASKKFILQSVNKKVYSLKTIRKFIW